MGRYRNVSILAAAIFIQVVGLAIQVKRHAENRSTRLIRVWTIAAITPLESNIVRLQTGASEIWHNYIFLRGVRQENRQLEDQIQQLQLEQVRLRQDAEQARRLQSLLGFKEQFVDKTLAAQVIGASGSEQSRLVYLDKGSSDGVAQDMAVISSQGAVGKVIQVFRHTSQVLLINDQTSGVGTILEQSRLQGVLKGRASGELVLDKIMADEDVKMGDRVLTSGGDQIFPKGLTVGTVANVRKSGEFLVVTVQPAASLNHLEEVLVITRKLEREPETSPSAPLRAADILSERLPSVPDTPVDPASGSKTEAGAAPKVSSAATVKPASSASAAAIPAAAKPATTPAEPKNSASASAHSPAATPAKNSSNSVPKTVNASSSLVPKNSLVPAASSQPANKSTASQTSKPVAKTAPSPSQSTPSGDIPQ